MYDRGSREIVVSSHHGVSVPEARALVRVLAKRCVYLFPQACEIGSREQVLRAIEQEYAIRLMEGIIYRAV